MTDRIKLDDLTSDQYDQLCDERDALRQVARGYCPDCGRGDAAPTVADWETERRRADTAENTVDRVQALADRWVKAGPPPLGSSISRWWDKRLVELHAALQPPAHNDGPTVAEAAAADRTWPLQKTGE